ncbi:type IA DNA topoisomerase, partial [Streptococcus thermophilus]|nr:type IA DNA topoisomerase [Streptococcus thermophilus]
RKNLDDFLQQYQLQTENQATLKSIEKELKSEYSPKLFNLSDLQKFANKRFKLTAQQTLTTVQSLYEKHKLLSYPR